MGTEESFIIRYVANVGHSVFKHPYDERRVVHPIQFLAEPAGETGVGVKPFHSGSF